MKRILASPYAAESEHQDSQGDEDLADWSYLCGQGGLGELDAVHRGVADSANEDDEGGAGADDQGVGEDSEGLDEALLYGVGGIGCGRHVRSRAHTGLIAEHSALDALHDGGADASSGQFPPSSAVSVPEAECVRDDQAEYLGNFSYIHGYDDKRQGDVEEGHHGDEQAAHAGDAPDAAEDDHEGQDREDDTHPPGRYVERQFP